MQYGLRPCVYDILVPTKFANFLGTMALTVRGGDLDNLDCPY